MKNIRHSLHLGAAALLITTLLPGCVGTAQSVRQEPPPRLYAQATSPRPVARPLATVYRYGNQWDEWFVRGDAAVATSPGVQRGARLTAWDGDSGDELSRVAVATAVYLVPVPPEANSVLIEVGYNVLDEAQNKKIGGFLFVRNRAVETRYAGTDAEARGALDEPGFYGDTYVLPADQTRAAFDLLAADRVTDGVLEVHLSAGAGQALDIQYLQVKAQAEAVPAPVVYQPAVPVTVVQYIEAPESYSYSYYYMGPWYCRTSHTVVTYTFFENDFHPFWFGGWVTYRAWFWDRHPWVCRPAHRGYVSRDWMYDRDDYRHRPGMGGGHGAVAVSVSNYRSAWYVRNFRVDAARLEPQQVTDCVRARRLVMTPARRDDLHAAARNVAEESRRVHDNVRQQMGDQYGERVRKWQENPAQARREISEIGKGEPAIQRAAARWHATAGQATVLPAAAAAPAPASRREAPVAAPKTEPGSAGSQGKGTWDRVRSDRVPPVAAPSRPSVPPPPEPVSVQPVPRVRPVSAPGQVTPVESHPSSARPDDDRKRNRGEPERGGVTTPVAPIVTPALPTPKTKPAVGPVWGGPAAAPAPVVQGTVAPRATVIPAVPRRDDERPGVKKDERRMQSQPLPAPTPVARPAVIVPAPAPTPAPRPVVMTPAAPAPASAAPAPVPVVRPLPSVPAATPAAPSVMVPRTQPAAPVVTGPAAAAPDAPVAGSVSGAVVTPGKTSDVRRRDLQGELQQDGQGQPTGTVKPGQDSRHDRGRRAP